MATEQVASVTTGHAGSARHGPESELSRPELARLLSRVERGDVGAEDIIATAEGSKDDSWVVGITGPPGAGKSTLVSALIAQLRLTQARVAVLAVDPSSPYTGGAVLGDRIRMTEHVGDEHVFIRSLANRGQEGGLARAVPLAVRALMAGGYGWIIVETVGVGQSEVDVARLADTTVVVTAPGLGDSIQADKAGVLEIADVLVVNKSDQAGATEAARDLTASVRLGRRGSSSWRCPVLVTRADTGDGLGELLAEIHRHQRFLVSTGELVPRRERRIVDQWRDRCRRAVMAELEDALADTVGQDLAQQVGMGTTTPRDALEALQANLRARGKQAKGTS